MTGGDIPKCTRVIMAMEFSDGKIVTFEAVEPRDARIDASRTLPEMDAGLFAGLYPAISFKPGTVQLTITPDHRHPITVTRGEQP